MEALVDYFSEVLLDVVGSTTKAFRKYPSRIYLYNLVLKLNNLLYLVYIDLILTNLINSGLYLFLKSSLL